MRNSKKGIYANNKCIYLGKSHLICNLCWYQVVEGCLLSGSHLVTAGFATCVEINPIKPRKFGWISDTFKFGWISDTFKVGFGQRTCF